MNLIAPKLNKKRDLTGLKIGEFLVKEHIGWVKVSGDNSALYKVVCSCGNIKEYHSKHLYKLKVKEKKANKEIKENGFTYKRIHCNDHPHHFTSARIGNKLGFLEVIDLVKDTGQITNKDGSNRKRIGKFLIVCICHAPNKNCIHSTKENPKYLSKWDWEDRLKKLKNKKYQTSCGCWAGVSHGFNIRDGEDLDMRIARMSTAAKRRAKERNLDFNLDPSYIKSLGMPSICPVLGIEIDYQANEKHDASPSIDKFYPKLGYVKGNVQIISYKANRIKSDGSPEEWEKIAEWCKKEDVRMSLEGNHPGQNKKS